MAQEEVKLGLEGCNIPMGFRSIKPSLFLKYSRHIQETETFNSLLNRRNILALLLLVYMFNASTQGTSACAAQVLGLTFLSLLLGRECVKQALSKLVLLLLQSKPKNLCLVSNSTILVTEKSRQLR